jgi:vacuole morphology and inheritance protein 14
MNPFTRVFLVTWITLLDSIPDLELVTYLPDFLGGLFRFLSDSNQDVHTATQVALDKFMLEIKKIARLKRGLAESKRSQTGEGIKRTESTSRSDLSRRSSRSIGSDMQNGDARKRRSLDIEDSADSDGVSSTGDDDANSVDIEEDWIPGQDVFVDHARILDILVTFLGGSSGEVAHMRLRKFVY